MMRNRLFGFGLAAILVLVGCSPLLARETPRSVSILEGVLAPTVESGGWLLECGEKTYLLLGARSHEKEPWFRAGAAVVVTGREEPETATIHMQGIPFRVERMRPR